MVRRERRAALVTFDGAALGVAVTVAPIIDPVSPGGARPHRNKEKQLSFETFEKPQTSFASDSLKPSEAQDRPLVVHVVERRENIVTKFQPAGAPGVIVDVADVKAEAVYVGVLWMNGALVDALTPYAGKTLPIRLVMTPSKKAGGYPYLSVEALDGADLEAAAKWDSANPDAFDKRRAELQAENGGAEASGGDQDVAALIAQLQAKQK